MLIVKSEAHIVRAGGKRINLEGIGKNIAARTMSICGEEQILLSKSGGVYTNSSSLKPIHNNYIKKIFKR